MLSKAVASNVGRMARGSSAPLALNQAQKRFLNLHEYQSLEVFSKFGVAVPKNMVVKPGEDVRKVTFICTSVCCMMIQRARVCRRTSRVRCCRQS